jgi:glycosyltransferase involved in cell wall biosynthesis
MSNSLPSISVITATYNSGKLLNKCLKLVREQDYPQEQIEIILGDGGSKDNTIEIAKTYKAKVLHIPLDKQHAEYNRGRAFNEANNDLVLILDHDNYLPYREWLKDLVKPLMDDTRIVATTTCYYHYEQSYSIIDRYLALFGASEPLPYYLKKNDRMPQTAKQWCLAGKAVDKGNYYLVEFDKDPRKIPSIGTNGTLMRRRLVMENADVRPDHHYPIDVMADVIRNGHNHFGFTKNSVIHLTGANGFFEFLKRRKTFMENYHFRDMSKRRWSVVMPGDGLHVAMYVLNSLMLVKPTWDAFCGFLKIRDVAWFLHPMMCFCTTIIYGYVTIKHQTIRRLSHIPFAPTHISNK